MYRVFLFSAFLALSIAAPFADVNWQQPAFSTQDRKFGQQPMQMIRDEQPDETEIVDSLGGGYSYFKKQPIVARPVMQQKLALKEQQVPISSFDDTPNQWSDYTKASAFKEQPKLRVTNINKNFLIKDQEAYGSSFVEEEKLQPIQIAVQDKPSISFDDNTYGQQDIRTLVSKQPLIPQQQLIQQRPLIRTDVSSFGEQDLTPDLTIKTNDAYGQQEPRTFVPQQPLIRTAPNTYGQQEPRTFVPQQPLIPQQQLIQQRPLIRTDVSSFGEQDLTPVVTPKSNDAYGQQEPRTFVPQQPLIRTAPSTYGQQDTRKFVPQQPLIRTAPSTYAQQDLTPITTFKSNDAYGQKDLRTLVPQKPLVRNFASSFGQQDLQQPWTVKSSSGYGQSMQDKHSVPTVNTFSDVQLTQPSWSVQQTELPRQSLPMRQSSSSGSFGGW